MSQTNLIGAYSGASGLVRAIVPVAALIGSVLALLAGVLFHPLWLLCLLVFVPIVALGLHDATQRRHTLLRNYPVAARIRWLFEDLRPFLRSYVVEGELEGRPFSRYQRAIVYARAKLDEEAHPFGTELDVYSSEYRFISHSMKPAPEMEGDPRVTVGGPQCGRPYSASVFNISAMSFGALSGNAIEALNLGAKRGGFYHDTGEGSISRYHRRHGGDLVWELGSGYFGCRHDDGSFDPAQFREQAQHDQVRMIEIKLSQGAKPGHGGVLPGAKVTPEIAEARRVPVGVDCISPSAHSAFSTPKEMLEFAASLREMSGGKPVGIKLCVGQPHEVMATMKAMLETGILLDYVVVDGAEGGTGAAPIELSNSVGMPLTEGLILVRNALVGCGLRENVRLAAAGKITSASGLAANAALGADWSNAARAFMFSLGCIQSLRCHTGTCPTGVATQDPRRQRGLVVEDKAERVKNFHNRTVAALKQVTAAAGLAHPSEFEPHHLNHRVSPTESRTIDRIYPFIAPGSLIEAPETTPYAAWWAVADPDSFAPRGDVGELHRAGYDRARHRGEKL